MRNIYIHVLVLDNGAKQKYRDYIKIYFSEKNADKKHTSKEPIDYLIVTTLRALSLEYIIILFL